MKQIRKVLSMILVCCLAMTALSAAVWAEDIYSDDVNNSPVVSFQNHTYQLFNDICSTWKSAEEYCESLDGHLATITSQEENDFLYSYITGQDIQSAYFGFTDEAEEGVWTWVTGEPVSYTNWNESEPNQENPNEDYAMFYYKYTDGTWNDGDFDNATVNSGGTAFICEWDESIHDNAGLAAEALRLAEIREYGEDGTRQSVIDLAYDESGNLVKKEIHYLYEAGETSSRIINNSFDEKGRLLLREYADGTLPFPIAEYRYDENDCLIYEATGEGSLLHNEYAYDENGQITEESESDGDTYTAVYDTHIYDDNGFLIQKSGVRAYITEETEYLTVEYSYDEAGRLILMHEQCDADSYSYDCTFEYSYRDAGPLEIVYCLDSYGEKTVTARILDAEGHSVAEYALYDELTFSDNGYLIRSSDSFGSYKQYIYEAADISNTAGDAAAP